MEKYLRLTCRVLHEKDHGKGMSRSTFFFIAMICSFCYYVFPGYLFSTLSSVSWVCWIWPRSVTAQQIGSGLSGLGLGAFGFDWSVIIAFLFGSPISPFFAIMKVFVGYSSQYTLQSLLLIGALTCTMQRLFLSSARICSLPKDKTIIFHRLSTINLSWILLLTIRVVKYI